MARHDLRFAKPIDARAIERPSKSAAHRTLHAFCALAYTVTDFSAATLFVIGSVQFGVRPAIKLVREIAYLRMGDYEVVAAKLD